MEDNRYRHQPLPLKKAVRDQVCGERLSDEEVCDLLSKQAAILGKSDICSAAKTTLDKDVSEHPKPPVALYRKPRLWALACAASCAVFFSIHTYTGYVQSTKISSLAEEIAANHIKLKPMDVEASSMADIRGFFTHLDFSPTYSDYLETTFSLTDQTMIGGRYCSVKGITAAQVRYQQGGGHVHTFYEVSYNPNTFGDLPKLVEGEAPEVRYVAGTTVTLWVEKGLLMALVETDD